MSYRAPIADIIFAMVHEVGIDLAHKDGVYADLGDGFAEATLTEAGKFAENVLAPLNRIGDQAWREVRSRQGHDRAGLCRGLPAMDRWGMERDHRPIRLWRHGFAGASQHRLHRNLERGEYGVQPLPAADAGCDRGYAIARDRSLEGALSRQARLR